MTDVNALLDLAGKPQPKAELDSLLQLAERVTVEAQDYDSRVVGNLDAIRDIAGPQNVKPMWGKGALEEIKIQPPAERAEDIRKSLISLFGSENVITDTRSGEISVRGGTEIGKRQLNRATKALSKSIRDQAKGTIGGLQRLGAKTKLTPEGTRTYLEEIFGRENIWPVDGDPGNFFVKSGGQWRWLDKPSRTEALDLVDVIPEIVEGGAGVAGAAIGARAMPMNPAVGAAAGGAIADALAGVGRQAVSGALPGEDFPGEEGLSEVAERAKLVGYNVAAGLAGEGVQAAGRVLNPVTAVGRKVGRELVAETAEDFLSGGGRQAEKIAEERLAVARKHKVGLSLGEATGSPTIQRLEGLLSDKPIVADFMQKARGKRIAELARATERAIKRTSGERVGAYEAGKRVESTYKALAANMKAERGEIADELYKRASEAAGGEKIIPLERTAQVVRDIAAESDLPLVPPGGETGAAALFKQLQEGGLPAVDIDTFKRMRSKWGKATRGKESVFGNSVSEDTTIAKRVFAAINADMEDLMASAPTELHKASTSPAGRALGILKEANEVYSLMSKKMDATQNVILDRAVKWGEKGIGEELEKLPDMILSKGVTSKQVATTVAILGVENPAAVRELRGEVLNSILASAKDTQSIFDLSPAKLAKLLRQNDDKIRHLFKNDMRGYKTLREIRQLSEHIREAPFVGGSKTAGMLFFTKALESFSQAGWSPRQFLSQASLLLAEKRLARILNDPTKAAEFLTIIKPPPGRASRVVQKTIRATSRLVGMLQREERLEGTE